MEYYKHQQQIIRFQVRL